MSHTQQSPGMTNACTGNANRDYQSRLKVTHVDAFGPYLKIFGQTNLQEMATINKKMTQMLPTCFTIDPTWPASRQKALLLPGTMCIHKQMIITSAAPVSYELQRARILNAVADDIMQQENSLLHVEVDFIDHGRRAVLPSYELFFPEYPIQLKNYPSQCTKYIMLGVCTDWKKSELDEILRMISQQILEINIEMEVEGWKFIAMKWKEFNFAEFLIHQKKMGAPIAKDLLRENFLKILRQINQNAEDANNPSDDEGDGYNVLPMPNNNNNNNYYVNANNHNNNVLMPPEVRWQDRLQEIVPKRSVNVRLQRQLRMPPQHVLNMPQPRVLTNIGSLRSMMQGIQYQNSRLPFTGMNPTQTSVLMNEYKSNDFARRNPTPVVATQGTRYVRPQPPQSLNNTTSLLYSRASYKSNNLAVGNTYDVYVSFVENGPCLFSVQLASAQGQLTEMMEKIEQIQLKPITGPLAIGTACIARYAEDKNMYRALITKVISGSNSCKVAYIDYGNSALVTFQDIYEIPNDFLTAKPFAIRFTLSGHKELEPIDESLKKAFKDLVMYQNCKLKVKPVEGPPIVQYCELYMQDKNTLNILKQIQKSRLVYPKADELKNNDVVEIRYIDSPSHFYVQKVSNISEFEQLMDDMFLYYNANQVVPNHLSLGAPCIVKYDNEWYRAEVMRADATAIVVRHVDFGYEQKVTKNLLSIIAEKHLILPRQAVQCCLKGFECNDKNLVTTQFEMLAEESNRKRRSFTVKVFRVQADGVNLINLFTKDLNVMKKLYKLSMPFDQYLSMEKEEFNVRMNSSSSAIKSNENGFKTPSIASSNDLSSVHSNKQIKNLLNSTPIDSEEQQKRLSKSPQQRNKTNAGDWERSSYASSMENRDSQSNSSDAKQGKQGKHQRQNKNNQQSLNTSTGSTSNSERRSNGYGEKSRHGNSDASSVSTYPDSSSLNSSDRRNNRQQSGGQQNQRSSRPQSAPQGYSQPRNKGNKSPEQSAITNYNKNYNDMVSANEQKSIEEYVPLNRPFNVQQIETPLKEEVIICWWISPHQFYTQLKSRIATFERLMQEMQLFYRRKPLQQLQLKVGSHVVARNRKENTMYRARIIGCNQMQRKYKVNCVDFGNQFTVSSDDIWQIEKRFADLPSMAYLCSFGGIISNYDHLYIIDLMEKYLPGNAMLTCEYMKREQDMYYVNINVNNISLKETLKADGIITEICPELRLNLLAGQQIRAKIISIKDMLNFKIKFEACDKDIQLLCSYDDLRFVKSNPDLVKKFKEFYEGKSCVLNIKDVNDNKVILLRPLMPLFKDDILKNICSPPIIVESFAARVVHVATGHRLYVQFIEHKTKIDQLQKRMNAFYGKNGTKNYLDKCEIGQNCAINGMGGNWYRARIMVTNKPNDEIEVFHIDYGRTQIVSKNKLQKLDKEFYANSNAYAIEVNLPWRPADLQQHKMKTVIDEVKKLTLDQNVIVKVYESNPLIADILLAKQKSVVDTLKDKQLIKGRDVEYMRKALAKERPNKFEYIEMVDLTLEDEDIEKISIKSGAPIQKQAPVKPEQNIVTKSSEPIPKYEPKKAEIMVKQLEEINNVPAPAKDIPNTEIDVKPPTPISIETQQPEREEEEPEPYAHMERAVLSHCDNPAKFFVHPYNKLAELHKLQENLQIVSSSLPPLMRVMNNAYCISHFSVDKNWYRAKILDAELLAIQFIDFGNTDCITDPTHIKEMSVFPDIEPMCMPCALPIKPNGTADWVDAANTIFNESYEKNLYFEYITRGDTNKRSFINLYIDGVNVADKIIRDGYAKPMEMIDSGENCYISHVNGITNFYIQYEKDSKVLELIEMYLEDYEKLPKLEKFEHSKIVAALFSDDEKWYRAKLLKKIPNKGYEVLFIDYGNTSVASECREISDKIAILPWLSKKCALELPEHYLMWSDEAEKKFNEIGVSETIFTVELREPATDHAIVHLFIDGHNIVDDLAPLCEQKPAELDLNASFYNSTIATSVYEMGTLYDAVVSHINSPWDFYVQFTKDTIRLEDITNTLNSLALNALEQVEVGQLCAARFPEDESFYRARILEVVSAEDKQYRVLFIDFGNEAITTDLRILSQDIKQLKEFSHHCKLENSEKLKQHGSGAIEFFNALIDFCVGIVKVDVVDGISDPATVKLYANNTNENICEKINMILGLEGGIHGDGAPMCLISHAVSPKNFYIQRKCDLPKLELMRKLFDKENIVKFPNMTTASVGDICVTYSSEDDCYLRGRIERILGNESNETRYEVFLMDYGNTIATTKLHELPKFWKSMPALATKCRLNAIPKAHTISILEQHFGALMELHFGEMFAINEENVDPVYGDHIVKLQVNYTDLADALAKAVEAGDESVDDLLAGPLLKDCTVVHVNSPDSFFLQLDDDIDQITQITDILLDAEKELEPFTELLVGAICAAQFPDDEAYYRAKIVKVLEGDDDGKCEVHFIDFGNNSITDKFRSLPAKLLDIPALSMHCSLEPHSMSFSLAATHFQTLIESRFSETFQVEFVTTTENKPNICRLFYQNRNVAAEVAQLLKDSKILRQQKKAVTKLSTSANSSYIEEHSFEATDAFGQ